MKFNVCRNTIFQTRFFFLTAYLENYSSKIPFRTKGASFFSQCYHLVWHTVCSYWFFQLINIHWILFHGTHLNTVLAVLNAVGTSTQCELLYSRFLTKTMARCVFIESLFFKYRARERYVKLDCGFNKVIMVYVDFRTKKEILIIIG